MIRRDFITELGGEIFDTRFHHVGVDNLLWAKAKKLNQAYRCEEAKFEHRHFSKGANYDAVYQKGWANAEEDRALLAKELSML